MILLLALSLLNVGNTWCQWFLFTDDVDHCNLLPSIQAKTMLGTSAQQSDLAWSNFSCPRIGCVFNICSLYTRSFSFVWQHLQKWRG